MTGYSDGTFRPNDKISRAELAVILDRYDQKNNEKLIHLFSVFQGMNLRVVYVTHKEAVILASAGLYPTAQPNLSTVQLVKDSSLSSEWQVYNVINGANYYLKWCGFGGGPTNICHWYGQFQQNPNLL